MRLMACIFPLLYATAAFGQMDAVESLAQEFLGDTTPGLGVLVMQQGAVVHMAGYGFANLDDETPVTVDSIFDLASVSKEMTALAARAQMEDGLYGEDTAIGDLLPQMAEIDSPRPITVGDVIHHLSGLTDYLSWDDYQSAMPNPSVLDWLAKQDLDHDPGTQFDYSNSGYVTLGSLVAAADGAEDLATVLRARIWDDAGMDDTALPDPRDSDRRVAGYRGEDGDFTAAFDPTQVQGDGNVFTTLADLARYEAGLWQGDYLEDTAALFTNGTYDDGTPITDEDGLGYGYGWELDGDTALHTGSWDGTSTLYQRNLATGVTVILLANGEDASLWELADAIEAVVE